MTTKKEWKFVEKAAKCPKCDSKMKVVETKWYEFPLATEYTLSCPNHGYFAMVVSHKLAEYLRSIDLKCESCKTKKVNFHTCKKRYLR